MARTRRKQDTMKTVVNVGAAGVGMYVGNAVSNAIANSDIGAQYPIADGAVPAVAGIVIASSSKDPRVQYLGAGVAATGIVKVIDQVMQKVNEPSNGFSRVNYKGSPQAVANNVFGVNIAGRSGRGMKLRQRLKSRFGDRDLNVGRQFSPGRKLNIGRQFSRKGRFKDRVKRPGVGFYSPKGC